MLSRIYLTIRNRDDSIRNEIGDITTDPIDI